jgi:hypothetical protein
MIEGLVMMLAAPSLVLISGEREVVVSETTVVSAEVEGIIVVSGSKTIRMYVYKKKQMLRKRDLKKNMKRFYPYKMFLLIYT